MRYWTIALVMLTAGCAEISLEETGRQAGKGVSRYCLASADARQSIRDRINDGMQQTCPNCEVAITCP